MEALDRIMKQIQESRGTSRNSKAEYKCPICRDTGWIEGEKGYKRCECFKKEHAVRLWKSFGVDPKRVKKLNDYFPYDEITAKAKNMAIEYIKNFSEIRNQENNSFGLFGQPGAGKSHIIIAMGAALISKGIQVVYMPYLEATRQLKANANDDEYYLRYSSKFLNSEILIIDDLFKDKVKNGQLIRDRYTNMSGLSESDIKHIQPILNSRYLNHLPTLFSSECTPEMFLELDESITGKIIEHCGTNFVVFKNTQNDYRLKKFAKER